MSEVAARSDLDRVATRIGEHVSDVGIDQVVEIGEPAERINHVAETRGVRAVLLASQGYSGTGPGGFGSTVSRVVRTSPLPVVVVRAGEQLPQPAAVTRFVIAHDGSGRSDRALGLVEGVARRLSAHLTS